MKTDIKLSESNSKAVALHLNRLLANEIVMQAKTRNSHWNVEGSSFIEMHELFERQYRELDEMIDSLAERVRSIGHFAEGRLVDILKLTDLLEGEYTNDKKTLLTNLLSDHETIIHQIRGMINEIIDTHNDAGSGDFVTGLLKQHEKMAWMVRAYLK
jgi:starvation-inducible DNA-binding protein